MGREVPEEFRMKDLFIDVKLEACVDGSSFDFLGRKLFSTEFFRDSVGFGITDINIEVNTSLQPLVTITFKDLYGATIFGGQSREAADDGQSIDYSVLFNWPPPKFLFSFKGYLGKPVSWVLNLKRTSTSFNSSDGSYDLKCEFVPNQWGFFADLPFLFLLAAKRLRKDRLGPEATRDEKKKITSVFDLIKIGKQVEVKTQETTKEFDELVTQIGAIKSNISRAATVSKIVEYGKKITGIVNNQPVKNFRKISIPSLKEMPTYNTEEKVEGALGIASELQKMNTLMLLSIKIEYNPGSGVFLDGFTQYGVSQTAAQNPSDPDVVAARNQVLDQLNKNLELVEDEIKRRVFATEETKLEKITIGEIFSQLAKDAAFIVGSILDAGLNGYRGSPNRTDIRDKNSNILIGQAFPMLIDDEGNEVPATKENFSKIGGQGELGVDENEMEFVRAFIRAISEGIARDLVSDSGNIPGQDDSVLKQRINNCEMASNNPYKPFYANIATNILVRGGIVGFMTRSNDPNAPGSYGNYVYDNDGRQQIEEIATRDSENITDTILSSMDNTDVLLLRRFCDFIIAFYDGEGDNRLSKFGNGTIAEKITAAGVSNVEYEIGGNKVTFRRLFNQLRKPAILNGYTVEGGELIFDQVEFSNKVVTSEFFAEKIPEGDLNAQNPLSFVAEDFSATKIVNNGLAYTWPHGIQGAGKYYGVLFRGARNTKASEVTNAPTDAQYRTEDKDATDAGQNEPKGYIPVNSINDDEGEPLGRIGTLIKYRDKTLSEKSLMYDEDKIRRPTPGFYGINETKNEGNLDEATVADLISQLTGANDVMWNNRVVQDETEAENTDMSQYEEEDVDFAGNIGYTVCHHQTTGNGAGYVFNFFQDTDEGRNQRIYVRKMCQLILQNLNRVEDERNQVIGSVLGKASEQEGVLYKQMHVIYHQWQSLSYSTNKVGVGFCGGDIDEFKNGDGGANGKVFGVAEALEAKYGDNHYNMYVNEILENGEELNSNGVPDGTFIYDFPLQRIQQNIEQVQVRDSIINLESLYKANGDTTVLNIIQQVCTKNNFLFVPIPGNPDYLGVKSIYSPSPEPANIDIKNFFHVLFTPTPESRTKTRNKDGTSLSLNSSQSNYAANSFVIKYGHPDNQIVSNISVGTEDTKPTAESIVNLQRLVDNENQNKKVTTDCSMLPVLAGRSYKASIDMLGNAQVYPMQFFFLENSPLFGGLYQVMKVKHSITPNDFKTSVDGIRMRFTPTSGYGSIKPITLDTFRRLGESEAPNAINPGFDAAQRALIQKGDELFVLDGPSQPVGNYTKETIERAVKAAGHKWFDTKGDWELNIVGVRNTDTGDVVTNRFDDYITLSYKVNGEWKFWSWPATTQPGKTYMESPLRSDGTAIVKPGQYLDSHKIRLHANSYQALGQKGNITVYRDANKDLAYDTDESTVTTGANYGINIHRSSPTGTSTQVNNWSAGCQVFANINDFNQFMKICNTAKAKHGNSFTYTLLLSSQVPAPETNVVQQSTGDFDNIINELEANLNIG